MGHSHTAKQLRRRKKNYETILIWKVAHFYGLARWRVFFWLTVCNFYKVSVNTAKKWWAEQSVCIWALVTFIVWKLVHTLNKWSYSPFLLLASWEPYWRVEKSDPSWHSIELVVGFYISKHIHSWYMDGFIASKHRLISIMNNECERMITLRNEP